MAADEPIYYCHNCETNVDRVVEFDDGCLKCTLCNEEYIEIVQSDYEEEEVDDVEEKKENNNNQQPINSNTMNQNNNNNNRNNQQIRFMNNGNTQIVYVNNFNNFNNFNINRFFNNFARLGGLGNNANTFGDYAFGDLNNIISSLGMNGSNGPPPANKEVVKGLKEYEFEEVEEGSNVKETDEDANHCAICKEAFGCGELLKEMPCDHVYHKECIEHWLNNANNCPVCRYRLKTDDVHYEQMHAQSQSQPQ
eukprot:181984_1